MEDMEDVYAATNRLHHVAVLASLGLYETLEFAGLDGDSTLYWRVEKDSNQKDILVKYDNEIPGALIWYEVDSLTYALESFHLYRIEDE